MDNRIHQLAQFIVLNSDLETNINGYESLFSTHFIFKYAQQYKKANYSDFAFELLQKHILKNVLLPYSQGILTKSSLIIYTGWYIIRFNIKGFFTIPDSEEILRPIDIILKEESVAICNEDESDNTFFKIQGIIVYCLERNKITSEEGKKEITKILENTLLLLISKKNIKINCRKSILIKIILNQLEGVDGIPNQVRDELFNLLSCINIKKVTRNNLLNEILMNVESNPINSDSILKDLIINEIEENIKSLYDQNIIPNRLKWNLILMYSLFLIEKDFYDKYIVIDKSYEILDKISSI